MFRSSANKTSLGDSEMHESEQVSPTSIVENRNSQDNGANRMGNTEVYKTHGERKGDHAANLVPTSPLNMASKVDVQEHKNNTQNRIQQAGAYLKNQNNKDNPTASNTENDPEIHNISNSSKYSRVFSSSVVTMASGGNGVRYKGHRRNISNMSGKPLITSDDYSSTSDLSCCSDDDAADANRPRHTHQKTKLHHHHRSMAPGDLSCNDTTGDRNVFNLTRDKHGDKTSHIIPIDDEEEKEEGLNNKDDEDIPGEPLKTFIAAILCFMGIVATMASLAFIHDRVPFQYDPLPDIFLDNIRYQHWGLDASEIMMMILVYTTVLVTLFHKHRFIVYRRIFLMGGLHYFYRSITMALTILPIADKNYQEDVCMPQSNQTTAFVIGQRVVKLISGMGLSINGKHVYCGDYIYSGHTMSMVMAYLIIKEYSPRRWVLLHYTALIVAIGGVSALLVARGHYSIDIVIAYWITTRIWWIFHTLANNPNLKEVDGFGKNGNNYLRKLWWWYIFRYFECNVPTCLPRRYNWPIPKVLLRYLSSLNCVQYVCLKLRRGKENHTFTSASTPGNGESNMPNSSDPTNGHNDLANVAAISIGT